MGFFLFFKVYLIITQNNNACVKICVKRPGHSLIYKQNFEKTKRQNRENNFIYSVKKTYIATAYHPLYTHTLIQSIHTRR